MRDKWINGGWILNSYGFEKIIMYCKKLRSVGKELNFEKKRKDEVEVRSSFFVYVFLCIVCFWNLNGGNWVYGCNL